MLTTFRKYGRMLAWAAAAVLAFSAVPAPGLISPNFTPVHLVKDSTLILELHVGAATDGKAAARVVRVLKGKCDDKALALALTAFGLEEHRKTAQKLLDVKDGLTACFFVCQTDPEGGAATAAGAAAKGYLHVEGVWMTFQQGKGKDWEMVKLDESLNKTWNGGTDMLIRAAEYILADPRADVPVKEGVTWAGNKQFATLEGVVSAATPVDLAGDGKWALHIACQGGDRLFRYDAKADELVDITAAVKLAAKSKVATWGDFNGDGRMDLLSYDGQALTIHTQAADGTFAAGKQQLKGALPDGCLSLTCIDLGTPAAASGPGVVISTRTSPLLWIPGQAAAPAQNLGKPIGGPFAGKDLGAPGLCLVADLDGDGLPDILQLLEKGSLVYPGKAPGQFQDAKACKVGFGNGDRHRSGGKDAASEPVPVSEAGAFLGDFDGDGLLDVFTVCSDGGSKLWSNRGKFAFADTFAMTGELPYKGASGALGGASGDFNNDGRQDVMFFYAAEPPKLYFNRGFRSFGLANGLEVSTNNGMLPKAEEGQQAGCLADLNGDGVQDMVVILKSGQAWVFYPESAEAPRNLRVALSPKAPGPGPVTLTAHRGPRCLGAWNLAAGTAEALIGLPEAGPVTLKWQAPGGKPQERKVVVTSKSVRVVLEPEKGG
jgi:hypothetical protein